ncbi:MAG TPA: hypothetical protein VJ486_01530 [Geothrix sp.]|nr:hypothetical protein [Geothrix sp.]
MGKALTEDEQIRAKAQRVRVKALAGHLRRAGLDVAIVTLRLGSLVQINNTLPNHSLRAFRKGIEAINDLVKAFYEANPGQRVRVVWGVTRSVYSLGNVVGVVIRGALGGDILAYALSENRKEVFVATETGVLALRATGVAEVSLVL